MHAKLLAGKCPWCGRFILHGRPGPEQTETKDPNEPLRFYRARLRELPELNESTFRDACSKLVSGQEDSSRELSGISLRFVLELAEALYTPRMNMSLLDFVQGCNLAMAQAACRFEEGALEAWKDIVQSAVTQVSEKFLGTEQ